MMNVQTRMEERGIILPTASNPAANYTNCVQMGDLPIIIDSSFVVDG